MTDRLALRDHLVDALHADCVGPYQGRAASWLPTQTVVPGRALPGLNLPLVHDSSGCAPAQRSRATRHLHFISLDLGLSELNELR